MPVAIENEQLATEVGYDAEPQSGLEMVSDSLCRNYLVVQPLSFISCPVSYDPAGEEARCGGPGLAWLYMIFE